MESDIIRGDGTEPARPMIIDFDDGFGAQAYAVVLDHEVHSGKNKHVLDKQQQARLRYKHTSTQSVDEDILEAYACMLEGKDITPATLKTPKNMKQVYNHPLKNEYLQAIADEYGALDKRGVWKLVPLPDGEIAHPTTLVLRLKQAANGEYMKCKARLCARGDLMTP